jgi:DNA-directed RNA polymerase sigma subunit (sigma70/sigma32)
MNHQIFNRELLARIIYDEYHPQKVKEMALMYSLGKNLDEIGDRFGVTRERIRTILSKHLERERLKIQ